MRHILRRQDAGYDVFVKNDGTDYWRLVKACIDENIDQAELIRNHPAMPQFRIDCGGREILLTPLVYTNPKRMVFKMDYDGRSFVLKRARMGSPGFKRFLPWMMGLTYFTRIMKKVNAATRAGCAVTQDFYLVAEKWLAPFRQEVWVLIQYLEGDLLLHAPDYTVHLDALRATASELLRHGLTMDDLTLGNFLLHENSVGAIDISCRPFTRLQSMKMTLKLNSRYGLNLPVTGLANRTVHGLLSLRYRIRRALGGKVE